MPVVVPLSLEEAVEALAHRPDALVVAGGTDVLVEINEGHRRVGHAESPTTVVAVDRVAELCTYRIDRAVREVEIGAGITYTELLAEPLASLLPALAEASRTVGSPQIRNAGTLGGNLGTCSPAGDGLPVLVALDARVHLASATGRRTVDVGEFMVGVKRTALEPGELITSVTLPLLRGGQGYAKVGVRNAMVIATASACVAVDVPSRSVRIALGSVAPTVIRCPEAEAFASDVVDWDAPGAPAVDPADAAELGRLATTASRPIDDHRSSAAYRRHAVGVMAERLLVRALARSTSGPCGRSTGAVPEGRP